MQILIDSKEPPSILGNILTEFPDAKSRNLGTNSGDALIQLANGILMIERKEVSDLCGSIVDGRLFAQCENIAALARFAFLIIDDKLYYQDGKLMSTRQGFGFAQTNWRESSIEAALVRVGMLGVIVVRDFLGQANYARCIKSLIALCENSDAPHANLKMRSLNMLDRSQQAKLDFLASLPGVGVDRASNLLQAFPNKSLNELLEWIQHPDHEVNLWGKVTHANIVKFLNHKGEP